MAGCPQPYTQPCPQCPLPMVPTVPTGYSGWVSLSEVDPDEEVQGEIHLRVELLEGGQRLRCTVLEAR